MTKKNPGVTKAEILEAMAEVAAEGLVQVRCTRGHVLSPAQLRAATCPTCGHIDPWTGVQYRSLAS
jgi:hypothetical protein